MLRRHMARAATRLFVPSFKPSFASRALSGTPALFQAEPVAENVSPQTASGRNVLDTHTVEDLHGMTASDILLETGTRKDAQMRHFTGPSVLELPLLGIVDGLTHCIVSQSTSGAQPLAMSV